MTDRKRLTEFCPEICVYLFGGYSSVCLPREINILVAHALVLKLEEKGMWMRFHSFAGWKWPAVAPENEHDWRFTYWLISDPQRFCSLVANFLKEQKNE